MKKMRISFLGLFCCFILLLSSGLPVDAAPTDPVTIPDAVLRSRIEDALNKAAGATITEADMATLTTLRADREHDIRELTGLEYAVNLKTLVFLRGIPQTRAQLFARPFWRTADLAPLKKLTKLEWLAFEGIVIFDMTPIANLTNLRALTFNYTYGITEIPDLSNLTELLHLRLVRNEITDISGVSGLTKLQQLDLGTNRNLSDITPLTQLRNLEILRLDQTLVTRESLSAVLRFMSPDIDQMQSTDFSLISITSGEFGITGTNISDLSVLDNFPDVFLHALYLRFMGTTRQGTYFFHLKDLTPLVKLMNKGKLINSKTNIYLAHNYGLDYPSFYEEIPALIAGSRYIEYVKNPNPQLEREFPQEPDYTGAARSRVTFKVRAVNTNPDFPANFLRLTPDRTTGENRQFAEVPVTWKVTAPDGTVSEQKVPTGDDGLSSFTFTPINPGEYTVEAIVPENTRPAAEGPSHEELKVKFTATFLEVAFSRTADGGGGSGSGGSSGARTQIPFGTQSFIFNEIGNFYNDTNDWVELKNMCNTPLDLSEWQMRLITTNEIELGGQLKMDVVAFPDFLLPAEAVLLMTNTDPSRTNLASGFNIATGARQRGAEHLYCVAPDLKLPSTPFLLVLQHTAPGNSRPPPTVIDVAGNYFLEALPDGTRIYFETYPPDATLPRAPLTELGAWQRQRLEQPGYLAAAWQPSGYRGGIGYDRHGAASVSLGTPGYRRAPSPSLPMVYRLAFNEIRNASNDTDDWIELKNVCGEGVRLKDWHISMIPYTGFPVDEEVRVVSFPDYTLPMGGVLLLTNTDPKETVLADGLNIATGGRQRGAQHRYLVAPDLKLPETPYLLILQHMPADGMKTIEDVAGNYAVPALPDGTPIYPHVNVSRLPAAALSPLARFGAWQRQHLEEPGYLAAAWVSIGYRGGIGYDRYAPASMCLGTPGYRSDAVPVLPETQRLIFNKIQNAADTPYNFVDYIELKNLSETAVRLQDWEMSSITSDGEHADEDVSIVRFPDWTLPAGGVLLILNTEPEPAIFDGHNIATDAEPMDTEERDAYRFYFVAPDLELPKTPYLLILRHAREKNGTPDAIEDVAGDYFRSVENTEVWPLAETRRPSAPAALLSEAGTYQRTDARQRGYLATAWTPIESQSVYAYDPDAFTTPPVTHRLVFNKIHNAARDTDDWIELKNISETAVRLQNWEVSRITSDGEHADEDVGILQFPDWTLPAGGVLLITNTDPDETLIVDGLNITPGANLRSPQPGAEHPYLVAPDLELPETPYLLILRHAGGKSGTPDAIADMAGDYFQSLNAAEDWHLGYVPYPSAPVAPLSEPGTYQRTDARQLGYLATAWTVATAPPGLSDTPPHFIGDDTHALFAPDAQIAGVFNPTLPDEVRISELMSETQGGSGVLPEWIELYNASATPVDLQGWQLRVETRIDRIYQHVHLTLNPMEIPPKQTVLLVNGKAEKHSHVLPPRRIYDLSEVPPDAFPPPRLSNTLLSRDGFFLQLIHPTGRVVDTCGTLDGDPRTHDLPTWTLPDSKTPEGDRVSLLRRFDGDVLAGTEASGWLPATAVAIGVAHYYGHRRDISTPGFLHQVVPGNSPTVALSLSEIMFTTQMPDRDGYLPQWIELYNPSLTRAVKLKDFQLVVETRHAGESYQLVIDLEAIDVLPNQTALLITRRGRHSKHFPANRVYNFPQRHPRAFRSEERWQHLLSSDGFLIQLADATGNIVDTVGNLDGYRFTEDTPAWTLPPGETLEGARAAIRRLYKKRGFPLDGRYREGWVSTAAAPPAILTYYGHASDVGNPGFRKGGPLPVVLSRLEAVRKTDTVEVSWTTQAALENAGFHLYRSTQRRSGFVRVNPKLIQGAGTTAERQTYTYIDKPPKTDRVYYYQLQEISYSGQVQVLATARLKGYLSADGKHLTTLGWVKTDQ